MPYETPLTLYRFILMDTREACLGYMILEEDIAEEDENIVTDCYNPPRISPPLE